MLYRENLINTRIHAMNQQVVKQARQTDLVAYLTAKGEELKQIGKNYTLKQHDSLFIKGNMFCWYSRNQQGNAVDFLMCYYGMTFKKAVEELTQQTFPRVSEPTQSITSSYKPVEPPQRAENEKRVLGYLCKKRGLKTAYIVNLIRQEKLFQDIRGNCNFVITDWQDKKIIGAEIVGTGDTRYKQITTHSTYGFHISVGEVVTDILYFESAIDLLSCYQLYQDKFTHHLFVSLGGLNGSIVSELYKLHSDKKHWLCVDNDQAGKDFIQQTMKNISAIRTFKPPKQYKDWNEIITDRKRSATDEQTTL